MAVEDTAGSLRPSLLPPGLHLSPLGAAFPVSYSPNPLTVPCPRPPPLKFTPPLPPALLKFTVRCLTPPLPLAASRMESTGVPGCIQVSTAAWACLGASQVRASLKRERFISCRWGPIEYTAVRYSLTQHVYITLHFYIIGSKGTRNGT